MNELIRLYKWASFEANTTIDRDGLTDNAIGQREGRRGSAQLVLDILEGTR